MTEFSNAKLGDFIEFQRGFDLPQQNRTAGKHPIVSSSGITDYHAESKVASPGVVTGRYGTVGKVFYLDQPFWPLNTTLWVKDFKGNHPKFVYYLLHMLDFNSCIDKSSVPGVNRNDLHLITIKIPPITEQRAIATVLGALDDKIELNSRMNATLEAAARALFKSWFVDFDPVKAKMAGNAPFGMDAATAALFPARLTESELGDIPEGWMVSTIGELGRVVTGKTPSTADPENFGNDIPFITIPDLNGRMYITSTQRYLSKAGAQKVSSSIIPKGAVMMSCIATVGLCGIAETASVTNQQINSLICKEGVSLPSYAFWQFRNITNDVISSGGGGSVYTNVSKSRFENIKVLCPDYRVQELFDQDWFKKLRENEAENAKLAKLRDYLLPKLISGEIRIPDAEKFVEGLV